MGIIFDCDGVIFDSNEMKNKLFSQTLSEYEEHHVEELLKYHKSNGGVSRYVKFRYFFEEILKVHAGDSVIDKLISDFSENCYRSYQSVSFTKGAYECIDALSSRHDLYVASGSDELELNRVFKDRGIAANFKTILGSPRPKADCLRQIVSDRPQDFVFVGDSTKDFEAASSVGVHCIMMPTYSDQPAAVEELTKYCDYIRNLEELVERY